jgi:hypothetical protein
MKKLMFVAGLLLSLSIISFAGGGDEMCDEEVGEGKSCTSIDNANNGTCKSSTSSTGSVTYYCVDVGFCDTKNCVK